MARKSTTEKTPGGGLAIRIADAVLDYLTRVPASKLAANPEPRAAARRVANVAAAKAAIAAGSFALPAGVIGWLTIVPELTTMWRIQARMVADLAALYGQEATLTREHMLYCLFRHSAAQAARDLVARVGERVLVKRASQQAIESVAQKIGTTVSRRAVRGRFSRWLPVIGVLGVGAYAYYDTARVAVTAIRLFEQEPEAKPKARARKRARA